MNQILKEANLLIQQTDRFKDMLIQVIYNYPKKEPQVTIANLLSYMISDRTLDYPTKKLMNRRSDELYGLSSQCRISSFGYLHQFELRFKTLNPSFFADESIEDVIAFMESIILRPLLNESSFMEAKTNLKLALLRIQDNPNIMGVRLAAQAISEEEPLSVYSQGSLELVETIKLADVIEFHHSLIQLQPSIVISSDRIINLKSFVSKLGIKQSNTQQSVYCFPNKKLKTATMDRDIVQSTLTQLYSSQISLMSNNYYALRILTMILGQLPSSLFFQEIREKHSLCYAISANLMSSEGLMLVQTGIDYKNVEQVKLLIDEQLKRLSAGDFPQKLLDSAKRLYIQNMERIDEDRNAYLTLLHQYQLMNKEFNFIEFKKSVKSLTKQDIVTVANELNCISESIIKGVQNA